MMDASQVAVGVLAWDYSRGARKDEAKKVKEEAYKAMVEGKFNLFHEVGNFQQLPIAVPETDVMLDLRRALKNDHAQTL